MTERTENKETHHGQEGYFIPLHLQPQDSEYSFADIVRTVRRRWFIIALTTLLCVVVASALAWLSEKTYLAEVVATPVQSVQASGNMLSLAGQFPGLAGLAGLGAQDSEIQEGIATLQSRAFISKFIDDERLLPVLFESSWSTADTAWTVPLDEEPSIWDGYNFFVQDVLSVSHNTVTGIITLSIEWRDPLRAAEWANGLMERLNERLRDRAVTEAQRSLKYLQEQLEETSLVELRQGMSRLIESQLNTVMLANSRQEYLLRVIDPAVPPDPDDFVKPNRPLLLITGLSGGLFLGILVALSVGPINRSAPIAL